MRTAQITLPALLSLSVKPLRLWWVRQQITNSQRKSFVMDLQRSQLSEEIRQEHLLEVQLKAKEMQIERGL